MLRSPVWEYIKTKCPSFVSMDCNAQFSEIFKEEVFSDLSAHEKDIIISNYIQHAFCNFCQQHISTNTSVFINYISLREVLCVGLSPLNWPEFIMQGNTTTKILCSPCNQNCCVQTSDTKMSNILFVEFSRGMMSVSLFDQHITIFRNNFNLIAMVRCLGFHFTSAVVENNGKWLLVDDLQDHCLLYN